MKIEVVPHFPRLEFNLGLVNIDDGVIHVIKKFCIRVPGNIYRMLICVPQTQQQ